MGDNASLPSAVAIKAGGDRIGIYQGKLKINARNVNEASLPIVLEGGARVDKNGGEYRIIAPTGEWVEVSGSSVLTIKVTVPKSRLSKMYGLLGNYNNSPNDDLKTRKERLSVLILITINCIRSMAIVGVFLSKSLYLFMKSAKLQQLLRI